ncbi:ankyrin repeat-containing domain protein [Aspergillus pseudoustus]|uniref:Ankyrin repeat-containing domain protein n=1 Tax=Aspergillus pseudoustus TaxID=1810923 RepID=A0ABR4JGU8_9EURO
MVRFLLANGSDIRCHTNYQETAVYLAARSGHDDVVRLLLSSGADSIALDHQGRPALHAAVMIGHHQVVYLFAEHGSPPLSLRDRLGRTALHLAAQKQDRDMVALLLEKGADVNAEDSVGKTALAFCREKTIRELLIAHGATDPQMPQESDNNGRIVELEDGYIESDRESASRLETLRQEAENFRRGQERRSMSSGRSSTSGRRLRRSDRNRGLSPRGNFTGSSDVYWSDEHYGRRGIRRDLVDRSRDGSDPHSRSYRLLHDRSYDEDKRGPYSKRNVADDKSDTSDMITLMVECLLILLVVLMVIVVVVVLAMLAMTVMMMGMVMWTMMSLMVIKWARVFWP